MLAALVLLLGLALLIGWEILCLGQVVLAERVRFLPRWLWAVDLHSARWHPLPTRRQGVDARRDPLSRSSRCPTRI